jgi:hypothetical protein
LKIYATTYNDCAFTFRSWDETLDAWSLGTSVYTSMLGR